MRSSGLSSSSIESLESRIAPAGVVTLDADRFGYTLTGDAAANDLLIEQDGTQIKFTPRNGTVILDAISGETIPSDESLTFPLFLNDLSIDMGTGADVLEIDGISVAGNLRIDSGFSEDPNVIDADEIQIANLKVAQSLSISVWSGTFNAAGDILYVGENAEIFSAASVFEVNAGSFFVGGNLNLEAWISENSDRFEILTQSLVVYNSFTIRPSDFADDAPEDAMVIGSEGIFNVGGSFRVVTDQFSSADLLLEAGVLDVTGKFTVENQSFEWPLGFTVNADAIRLHSGLGIASKSFNSTSVVLNGDLVMIDGNVNAKFPNGSGELSISADNLFIDGNVKFVTKGTGILRLEGAGDIFGKVSASLGSGTGEVTVRGNGVDQLFFDGLAVTTPAKLPSTPNGAAITVRDVSIFGSTSLRLGPGVDTVNIDDSDFYGSAFISTGAGNDVVGIHTESSFNSNFYRGIGVTLGSGDDTLTLGMTTTGDPATAPKVTFFKRAIFDGSTGNDTFLAEGRIVSFQKSPSRPVETSPLVMGFETRA